MDISITTVIANCHWGWVFLTVSFCNCCIHHVTHWCWVPVSTTFCGCGCMLLTEVACEDISSPLDSVASSRRSGHSGYKQSTECDSYLSRPLQRRELRTFVLDLSGRPVQEGVFKPSVYGSFGPPGWCFLRPTSQERWPADSSGEATASTLAAEKLEEEVTFLVGVRKEGEKAAEEPRRDEIRASRCQQEGAVEENGKSLLDNLEVVYDIKDVLEPWRWYSRIKRPDEGVDEDYVFSRERLDEIIKLTNDYNLSSVRGSDKCVIPKRLTIAFDEVKELDARNIIEQK
ncbi:hypothetical protein Dimus_027666 [Dionaea muscipula]